MTTYIGLLRGINVGKANRVPMAALRAILEGLGYENVITLLNSGNAVFRTNGGEPLVFASRIVAAVERALGVRVPVIVKSAAELAAIVRENPFALEASEHARCLVAFVQADKDLDNLVEVSALVEPPEQFVIGKHAAWLHCPDGISNSKAGAALLGKLGRVATTRNWATVLKLATAVG